MIDFVVPKQSQIDKVTAYLENFKDTQQPFMENKKDNRGLTLKNAYQYRKDVREFFALLQESEWDYLDYLSPEIREFIKYPDKIQFATLKQIKGILTYCLKGERYVEGHRNVMLKRGVVQEALKRLKNLDTQEQKAYA
ncbi:MAG: DUF6508 domain-containing protein [candidate division KSB1 bacterium]|nr:DUF6508 domain-containing protein [candidate division KSB1 bacterium]